MFVRNAWVHTRFLKGKGTLDSVKEDHSVTERESPFPPLAGSKKKFMHASGGIKDKFMHAFPL